MKAKIILNQPLTQDRYGLHFVKGEAYTDSQYLIKKLQLKGVKVEIIKEDSNDLNNMTLSELKKYAKDNNLRLSKELKNKDSILNYLKENSGENPQIQNQDENSGENPQIQNQNETPGENPQIQNQDETPGENPEE